MLQTADLYFQTVSEGTSSVCVNWPCELGLDAHRRKPRASARSSRSSARKSAYAELDRVQQRKLLDGTASTAGTLTFQVEYPQQHG
ncbi:MAG: hypothetical protein U1F43_33850 [Myxococcota bacterium]